MQLPRFTANASISSTGHNYEMGGAPVAPAERAKVTPQHFLICPSISWTRCTYDGGRAAWVLFDCARLRGGRHWHKMRCG